MAGHPVCLTEGKLQNLPAVPGPRPRGAGLQPLQGRGHRRPGCPEVAGAGGCRSHPCLGQLGPLSRLCSASMGHSAQGSGGQWCQCKVAVPILGSTVGPRWALIPRQTGKCLLGSDRGAWMLPGDKHMSLCRRFFSCLGYTRMPYTLDVDEPGASGLSSLPSFLSPALTLPA